MHTCTRTRGAGVDTSAFAPVYKTSESALTSSMSDEQQGDGQAETALHRRPLHALPPAISHVPPAHALVSTGDEQSPVYVSSTPRPAPVGLQATAWRPASNTALGVDRP